MFNEILLFLILFIVCFIPILGWGYLFTYYDDSNFNRNRFLIGIFAGIISVYPVLYLGEFINKYELSFLNPFLYVSQLNVFQDYLNLFISFIIIIFILVFLPFFIFNIKNIKKKGFLYIKKFLLFSSFSVFLLFFLFILNNFFNFKQEFDFDLNTGIYFLEIGFNSFKLVIFYYILIALFEELSKFFNFSNGKYFEIKNIQEGVLFSMFVALGFGFIENILYLKNIYEINKTIDFGVIGVFISRNIFSVFLHVLCSSIFAYFFSKAYLNFSHKKIEFIKFSFIGFLLSIFLHSFFNIFLTLQITFIVFLYLILGYFYLTYIFYKE